MKFQKINVIIQRIFLIKDRDAHTNFRTLRTPYSYFLLVKMAVPRAKIRTPGVRYASYSVLSVLDAENNDKSSCMSIPDQREINKLEVAMNILKKQNEELMTKNKRLEEERDAETKKSLQCQSDLRDQQTSLSSALNEKQRIESQFNRLESSKDAAERQASHCNRELGSKRSQVYRLESENEKLENAGERCQSNLRVQKTSLTSALNEKQIIESQFKYQKITINRLESSKDAAERQASYCNRELSIKRSEVYRLESENEKLENSDENVRKCLKDLRDQKTSLTSTVIAKQRIERQFYEQKTTINQLKSSNEKLENSEQKCNRDLRNQKVSLKSMEGRYNLLIRCEFYLSSNRFLLF